MKTFITLSLIIVLFSCKQNTTENTVLAAHTESDTQYAKPSERETIYQFKVSDLYGNAFDFSTLKGKKIMIVNTASECGLTPQYEQLQELYDAYKDSRFVIIGFPANNFGGQEPGSNTQIAAFCKSNYGVTFPMMGKISVKGKDMHQVYQFLTQKSKNGLEDSGVQWNFQKYLIDESGYLVRVVSPKTLPTDQSIISWIKS